MEQKVAEITEVISLLSPSTLLPQGSIVHSLFKLPLGKNHDVIRAVTEAHKKRGPGLLDVSPRLIIHFRDSGLSEGISKLRP